MNIKKKKCIIVDLDGTLFNHSKRQHLAAAAKWDDYNARIGEDTINEPVASIVRAMDRDHHAIIYCTGRFQKYEGQTREMLTKYSLPLDRLFMRKNNDMRSDDIIKAEMLAKIDEEVFFVMDDRNSVVKMWRRAGLFVMQVAEGDF